jgi:eukaryotic-like serine/threonine-protein kinase
VSAVRSELPADALQGLCPHCLLQGGLSSATPPRDSASTTGPGAAFSAPTPAELALMFPQLEIIELLGQRGMGAVYKARQVKLDRFVALTVLPSASGQDPAFVERFALRSPCLACRTTCRGGS